MIRHANTIALKRHALKREMARRCASKDLLSFTTFTKPNYQINWHHRLLCKALDEFVAGKIRFLMVFMPPRHGKSELVSRRLPAYLHGRFPNDEIMAASYSSSLANDMTSDVQKIIDTPEYQAVFPGTKIPPAGTRDPLARRNAEEHHIIGTEKGKYRGQGVGGSFTGKGANWLIIDDPIKGHEAADSAPTREHLHKWYTGEARSRLESGGQVLITLTRWHEDDLAGRLIEKMRTEPDADQWKVLSLPAVCESDTIADDPRQIGEPLWPEKYDGKALSAIKANSSRDWNSLYQQRPSAMEGNIFKREDWRYYGGNTGVTLPDRFDAVIQSWDFAFKDKQQNSYVVGLVLARRGAHKYLLDQERGHMGFTASVKAVRTLTAKWPAASKKYIEDKANGPAIIDTLHDEISGLIAVEPDGDKVARAYAVSGESESHNVWLPHSSIAPWIEAFVSELADFPNGLFNDRVDAYTLGMKELKHAGPVLRPISGHGSGSIFNG